MVSLSLEKNWIAVSRYSGHPRKDFSIASWGCKFSLLTEVKSVSVFGRKKVAPKVSILVNVNRTTFNQQESFR